MFWSKLIVCSLRPGGRVSDSISVMNPYSYSLFNFESIICFSLGMISNIWCEKKLGGKTSTAPAGAFSVGVLYLKSAIE